jgi:hypothetical protein
MTRRPPRVTREELHTTPRIEERDGKLWLWLGSGPLVEHVAGEFVKMFPGAEIFIDDVLEDVLVHEPGMAAEHYAHLGAKVSVEWFRRE